MSVSDILFERRGNLGLVTLNRPQAMNALTHAVALQLDRQLAEWAEDPGVAAVAIQGAGDKAFCAGGDIRALHEAGAPGGERGSNNFPFYADEYRLNARIKRYPKPYVALMDGVVMGGGVGVSIHGTRRVAGDRTLFAMPETGIGLFPDVGGTFFLPRLPGETGLFAGLTGARFRSADALAAGVCDVFVPSERQDDLLEALAGVAPGSDALAEVDCLISAHSTAAPGATPIADRRADIDRCFSGGSVEDILSALDGDGSDWAREQATAIRQKSPTSTRIAFRQLREGARLGFEDCMKLEYRLARFCMQHGDFYEGVRAVIIDRDNAPRWSPDTLAEADDRFVAPAFASLGSEDLTL